MNPIKLYTKKKKLLADTLTPVGLYLRLRDLFPGSVLLESSDYHGDEHSFSYICFDSIAEFKVENETIFTSFPGQEASVVAIKDRHDVIDGLHQFYQSFDVEKNDYKFITDGIFGYTSYNAVRYFEDLEIKSFDSSAREIPDMIYKVYSCISCSIILIMKSIFLIILLKRKKIVCQRSKKSFFLKIWLLTISEH